MNRYRLLTVINRGIIVYDSEAVDELAETIPGVVKVFSYEEYGRKKAEEEAMWLVHELNVNV